MVWFVAIDALAGDRLEDPVRPTAQRVSVAIDPAQTTFSGSTAITLDVTDKIEGFTLHADELQLGGVGIGRPGKRARPATATVGEHGLVRIDAGRRLKPGAWQVHLDYTGTLHEHTYGLYRFEVDGVPYVASQFQADDARTAWPCFDEPSFKVPLALEVTTPDGNVVIANAPATSQAPAGEGTTRWSFAPTPPIPTYAGALLVGPYVEAELPFGGVYTVRGHEAHARGVVEALPGIVSALEQWFGQPQPYAKLDVVVVPEFSFGAMENPGAIVAAEAFVPPPDRALPEQAEFLHHLLVHEVAHLWFGDLVTMRWWDDLWLNESFAEWMGRRITAQMRPEFAGELGQVERLGGMLQADALASSQPLRTEVDPNAVFETSNFAVYPKGEALLDMVERWIGPEAFQGGLRAYLGAHAWGNASSADLFAALGTASGRDVAGVMGPYLDQPGAPMLRFAPGERPGQLVVRQEPLAVAFAEPPSDGPWVVPVRVRVGRADGRTDVVTGLLGADEDLVLDVGDAAWVMPAADGAGYYAWSLPDARLDALTDAPLSPPERANVVQMLAIQRLAGDRPLADLLGRLAARLPREDLRGMRQIVDQLDALRIVDVMGDPELRRAADAWTRTHLRPVLDRVGMAPVADEPVVNGELRVRLLGALAAAGDAEVIAYGESVGLRAASDPSIPPGVAAFGLQTLARHTGTPAATQAMLWEWAEAAEDPTMRRQLLSAFGQVVGPEALTAAFARAADPTTSPSDQFAILGSGVTARNDEAERDAVLDLAIANHEALVAKVPPVYHPQLARYGGGCSEDRLDRARAFYLDPARARPGTDQVFAELTESVAACRRRIAQDGPGLRAMLLGGG